MRQTYCSSLLNLAMSRMFALVWYTRECVVNVKFVRVHWRSASIEKEACVNSTTLVVLIVPARLMMERRKGEMSAGGRIEYCLSS